MTSKQLWQWEGITRQGARENGFCWAQNRADAMLALQSEGISLLTLRPRSIRKRYWHIEYVIQFARQLATLLQAGVTLADGLTLIAQQHPVPQWRALLTHLTQQILHGQPLSQALQQWPAVFSPLFCALIETGELTGKLEECCLHLAAQQEEQWILKKKVVKALRYPGFVVAVAIVVTLGMLGFVLPEFTAIYQSFDTPLPALTRGVIALSEWLESGWRYAIATGIAIMAIGRFLRRNAHYHQLSQRLLLRMPLAGELVRGQRLSQIYTVMTLTQQAGIPLLNGLGCASKTLPAQYWHQALDRLRERVAEGEPLWRAMEQETVFSPWCVPLIRTGESTGALDVMLQRLAAIHSGRTRERADNLAASLEPIIMVVMGVIIGTLVVAMYLPIFHLGDAMSAG